MAFVQIGGRGAVVAVSGACTGSGRPVPQNLRNQLIYYMMFLWPYAARNAVSSTLSTIKRSILPEHVQRIDDHLFIKLFWKTIHFRISNYLCIWVFSCSCCCEFRCGKSESFRSMLNLFGRYTYNSIL